MSDKKLLFACKNGNQLWLDAALKEGVDPNLKNSDGTCALVIAATHGNTEICIALLEAGADLDERAIQVASDSGHSETRDALEKWAEDPVPVDVGSWHDLADQQWALVKAVQKEEIGTVQKLLTAGTDVNTPFHSEKPLVVAVLNGNTKIVELLVENGAILEERSGVDALIDAVRFNNPDAFSTLRSLGADLTAANQFGRTPLHEAARTGNAEFVQLMLDEGADPNAADERGLTPFIEAFDREKHAVTSLLAPPDLSDTAWEAICVVFAQDYERVEDLRPISSSDGRAIASLLSGGLPLREQQSALLHLLAGHRLSELRRTALTILDTEIKHPAAHQWYCDGLAALAELDGEDAAATYHLHSIGSIEAAAAAAAAKLKKKKR